MNYSGTSVGGSYDGGKDSDELVVNLTAAAYDDPAVRAELLEYQEWLQGDHSRDSSGLHGDTFHFDTLGIDVRNVETLSVVVDGQAVVLGPIEDEPEPEPDPVVTLFTNSADTVDFNSLAVTDAAGADLYHALDGDDLVRLPNSQAAADALGYEVTSAFEGGLGNDTVHGGTLGDVIDGGAGDDWIYGGSGSDSVIGGDGNDRLDGNAGDDAYDGGAGNDYVLDNYGNNRVDLGAGDDYINCGSGNDTLIGGTGRDELYGNAGDDVLQLTFEVRTAPAASMSECDVAYGGDGYDKLVLEFSSRDELDAVLPQLQQLATQALANPNAVVTSYDLGMFVMGVEEFAVMVDGVEMSLFAV